MGIKEDISLRNSTLRWLCYDQPRLENVLVKLGAGIHPFVAINVH